jgi:hypothetical protein
VLDGRESRHRRGTRRPGRRPGGRDVRRGSGEVEGLLDHDLGGRRRHRCITASTGPTGLTAASDLSSASAPAVGPFLTGTLGFAGEPTTGMSTPGTITGDFAARFDSIGSQSLPAGTAATLMRRQERLTRTVEAGSRSSAAAGRTGRGSKLPPQFGHTPPTAYGPTLVRA